MPWGYRLECLAFLKYTHCPLWYSLLKECQSVAAHWRSEIACLSPSSQHHIYNYRLPETLTSRKITRVSHTWTSLLPAPPTLHHVHHRNTELYVCLLERKELFQQKCRIQTRNFSSFTDPGLGWLPFGTLVFITMVTLPTQWPWAFTGFTLRIHLNTRQHILSPSSQGDLFAGLNSHTKIYK